MSIRIVTDSNCDLPQAMLDEYAITVIPLYINIGSKSYLDEVEMSRADFYEGLPDFEAQPTTSVPGPGTFIEVYQKLADQQSAQRPRLMRHNKKVPPPRTGDLMWNES